MELFGYLSGVSLLVLVAVLFSPVSSCTFPSEWKGSWYQREGETQITRTQMSSKGSCHSREGDKYIIKKADRDGNVCYRCLAIKQRHENILQYKESHCEEDISSVCSSIRGDATLYTLVRESLPKIVPCPFEGPLTFQYDNGTGLCDYPVSTIGACANPAHLKFHFKDCYEAATDPLHLQLTCLATWRDGADYIFGKFSGPGYTTKNLRYRCMTYDKRKNTIAVSADSTCRGVLTFDLAPLQIFLGQGKPDTETTPTCSFPSWLTSTTWRDLSGHTIYQPVGAKKIHIKQGPGRHGHIHESTLRCRQVAKQNTSSYEIVSYTTHGCTSNFQCIRVSKMAPDGSVLEIQSGRSVHHMADACSEENMMNTTKYTIIANSSNIMQCPYRGFYSLESSTRCSDVINTRCDDDGQIVIDSCNTEVGSLRCIASWSDKKKVHIIASSPTSHRANCFVFTTVGDQYRIELDSHCNNGVSPILRSAHPSYTLKKITGTCLVKENEGTSSSSASTRNRNNIVLESNDTSSSTQVRLAQTYSLLVIHVLLAILMVAL